MRMLIAVIILALIALGIAHFVREHIRRTREELKNVDRSKLRDLDEDDWDDDDWGRSNDKHDS